MKPQLRFTGNLILATIIYLFSSAFTTNSNVNEGVDDSSMYEALHYRVNKTAVDAAVSGFSKLNTLGHELKENLIVVDYSKSANTPRFFVINMRDTSLTHSLLVAHGKNSGELFATEFSNKVGSYQSSLGFFKTAETYDGKHGLSLRLDGLEAGINDKARERAIVIHAADYVSENFITAHGRLGRSHGCPALPIENYENVIDDIKNGCLLFIYGGNTEYLHKSPLLASL